MRKIRTTIILIIGVFIILSLGTVGALSLSAATKALETETSNRLEAMAQQKSSELEIKLLSIEQRIQLLNSILKRSFDPSMLDKPVNSADMTTHINSIHTSVNQTLKDFDNSYSVYAVLKPEIFNKVYSSIFIEDESNTGTLLLEDVLTVNDLRNQTPDMDWYHQPLNQGKGVWSNPYYDSFLDREIITYSEPIYVGDTVIGVVGTDLIFDDFKSFVSSITVFETGYAFLMNENHDNIVHPTLESHTNMRTVENGLYIPISNKMHSQEHGSIRYRFFGVDKIMGFDHLYNGWVIGIAPPLEEVNASLNNMRQALLISIIIATGIFMIIGSMVGKYLSKPIESLSEQMTLIGQGDLSQSIDISLTNRATEFGILANSIEKMRLKQTEVIEELRNHNQILDREVENRTNELLEINQELEASLTSLKDAQETIVDMHEQELIHELVQHITQTLSVPIANTMTASSYLIEQAGLPTQYKQSSQIIYDSQQQVKELLVSLKQLTEDYSDEPYRHFPIKAYINHTVHNILSEGASSQQVILNGDGQLMATLPMDLTTRLFTNITRHALKVHKYYKSDPIIQFDIIPGKDLLTIAYYDAIPWQTNIKARLFNPYYQSELVGQSSGLELFLIQHIVAKGLQGTIDMVESDDHKVILLLKLPQPTEVS